jgi:hypothetical protein
MKIRDIALAVFCCLIAVAAFAQGEDHEGHGMSEEQMMMMQKWQEAATPGPQHAMMAESAGTYKLTVKSWYVPGGEPEVSEATAEREMMMGGRYMKETVEGSMGEGQTFKGMGLAGYDNVTGKHWSTWMDNMSTGLSKMTGDYDPETKTLTMTG